VDRERGSAAASFVGVDVSFVFSGFLITRNRFLAMERERFSLAARCERDLLPARLYAGVPVQRRAPPQPAG